MQLIAERVPDLERLPFSVPCFRSLDLAFNSRVTFLVGENGCGKSTLLEGLAHQEGRVILSCRPPSQNTQLLRSGGWSRDCTEVEP